MLDALAVGFEVIHRVVHLPLVLVEPNRGVVGRADVPKGIDRTARVDGNVADPTLFAGRQNPDCRDASM